MAHLFSKRATLPAGRGPWCGISVFDFDRICVTRVSDDCVNCVCLVACIIRWYHESLQWAKMIRSCRLVGHHFGTVPLVLLDLLANPELERKWKYAGA